MLLYLVIINHIDCEKLLTALYTELFVLKLNKARISMKLYSNDLIGSVEDLDVSDIVPSSNLLRTTMNDMKGLAESLKKIGLLEPIVVRTNSSGSFEIVAGNRRFNACRKLGWRKITCHVVELDDKTAFEASIIENVQRQSLNPIDEGLAFRKYVNKFGWGSISELAQKISKSPSYVCKRIKLVELSKDVVDLISSSEINVSVAEELLSMKDKDKQYKIAVIIRNKKLSSRNTRGIIKHNLVKYDMDPLYSPGNDDYHWGKERILKSFDKSIIALRLAIKKLGSIVEGVGDDWLFYNILLHHKNILNSEIDLLIKEKRKYKKNPLIFRRRKIS
jgi:ParB family transcriptional regulator, chromosome partitioning protein